MAKKKSFKTALVMAILSIVLCVSMFAGTTFAWFTDSVTSANNVIQSGTLKIAMQYDNDETADWTDFTSTTNVFKTNALWEPGHVEVIKFKIKNAGTLALKYQLGVYIAKETGSVNKNGEDFKLSQFIKYGIVDGELADGVTREDAIAAVEADSAAFKATSLQNEYNSQTKSLVATNEEKIITMVVYMPTTVGNDANAQVGAVVPTIELGISLNATQFGAESDSFDNTYDDDAWIEGMKVYNASDLQAALTNGGNVVLMNDIELDETIVIPAAPTTTFSLRRSISYQVLNLNGKTISGNVADKGAIIKNEGNLQLVNGTVNSEAENGGSAIMNKGNLIVENAILNGAPNAGSSWPSYTVNNVGTMTVNNSKITSYHGAVCSYTEGAVVTLNNSEIDMAGIPGFTSHGIYTYNGGSVVVNSGTYVNRDTTQSATGASVINGAVTIKDGSFTGRLENYYGTPVIKGGTFSENPTKFLAEGYTATLTDGVYVVGLPASSMENLIKEAAVNGGTVSVPAGTYTFPASSLKEGVTLECAEGTKFVGTSSLNVDGATIKGAEFVNDNGYAVSGTINGVFENCVFEASEALRWCYTNEGDTIVFENCVFKTDFRGIHFDGMNGDIIFRNCEINGFNAYSGTGTMTFENCTFGYDESYYNGLNIYTDTFITDSTFNYKSGKSDFVDMEGEGKTLTINNCVAYQDGEEIDIFTKVGGSKLDKNTVIIDGVTKKKASSQTQLNNSLSGDAQVTLSAGDYSLPSVTDGDVAINGDEDVVITINKPAYHNSNVTLNGVTVKGSGYSTGIQHVKAVTYNDATIIGDMCLYGEKVVFNNCTFELNNQYIWTYGAAVVEFNNCTFNTTGKAILIYNEGAGASKVTVKGCKFNASAGAKAGAIANQNCAAIELDNFQSSGVGAAHTLITENNTYSSNFSGEWRIKNFVAGNAITVNGVAYNQIAVDGKLMTIDANKNVTVQG